MEDVQHQESVGSIGYLTSCFGTSNLLKNQSIVIGLFALYKLECCLNTLEFCDNVSWP